MLSVEEIKEFFDWSNLHEHQKTYIRTRARNPLEVGAVGSGKTRAGICRSICLSANTPYFGNLTGNKGIIGRLKRTDLEDTTMADFIELIEPTGWIKRYPKQPRYIMELINGSEIQFVPMENFERFLSRELGWGYFEQIEEGDQRKSFEEIDLHRLRKMKTKIGEPVLFHSAFAVCNPTTNWVYELWGTNEECLESKDERERRSYDPNLLTIHSSTYDNAQNLPVDYIPNMEKKYGGRNSEKGKMYLLGMWGTSLRAVYNWNENLVLDEDKWPSLDIPTWIGIDYGWGAEGVTSIGFYSVDKISNSVIDILCYDELYLKGYPDNGIDETTEAIDNLLQFHFVKRLENSYHMSEDNVIKPRIWVGDPAMRSRLPRVGREDEEKTIAQAFEESFFQRGINVGITKGNNNVALGTDKVNWFLNNAFLHFNPRCVHHRKSIKNLMWDKDNKTKLEKGQDDHPADGCRYLVMETQGLYKQPRPENKETLYERVKRKREERRKKILQPIGLGRLYL